MWGLSHTRRDVQTKQVLCNIFAKGTVWSGSFNRQAPCLAWSYSGADVRCQQRSASEKLGGSSQEQGGRVPGLHGQDWASGQGRSVKVCASGSRVPEAGSDSPLF